MASQYYQIVEDVIADGIDSQRGPNRRWLKVGVALCCGSCLALLYVAASASMATVQSISDESTSLVGLSRSFRSSFSGAARSSIVKRIGPPMVRTGAGTFPLSERSGMDQQETLSDGVMVRKLPNGERVYSFPDFKSVNPVEKLAVTAISAVQTEDNTVTEAVKDQLTKELSNMDDATKAQVAKAQEAVKLKAQDMAFPNLVAGVTAPLGFFDPLGFSTDVSEGKLLFYREVEVKHGRIAMLASLGILVAEQFHPLFGGNIDVPAYVAFQQTPLQNFWPAVLVAIAIPEIEQIKTFNPPFSGRDEGYAIVDGFSIRSDRVPGDFGFDPLGLKPMNPKEFKEMQTKEINNGRLAMIAAAGMIAQEIATRHKIF